MNNSLLLLLISSIILISCSNAQTGDQHQNNSDQIDEQQSDSIVIFHLYGEKLPDIYIDYGDDSITEPYGFRVERVAGCEVTVDLMETARQINMKSDAIMVKRIGKDWRKKFETETGKQLITPMEY